MNISCENCGGDGSKVCSRCCSGHYCSDKCQREAWAQHREWCGRIADTTKSNPWYAEQSPSEPKFVSPIMTSVNEVALNLDAAITKYIANINTVREPTGMSLLHIAVTIGDLAAISRILELGGYVNSADWRRNTPLYYACSHPGLDFSGDPDGNGGLGYTYYHNNKETSSPLDRARDDIVTALIRAGADTMGQGGYSGKRPFEIAEECGYTSVAQIILTSPEHAERVEVRALINSDVQGDMRRKVKKFVDAYWRGETCHWLIQPNRHLMGDCFRPHPALVHNSASMTQLDRIELFFQDTVARSRTW
jgi:MYND finger